MKNELLKLCNITDINQGNDLEIYLDNFLLTITNTFNQNKNEKLNTNKTTINLAECETKLKSVYNISIKFIFMRKYKNRYIYSNNFK